MSGNRQPWTDALWFRGGLPAVPLAALWLPMTCERDLPAFVDERALDEPWVFVGLDGEMSSVDLAAGGRLIQVGAAAWRHEPGGPLDVFCSLLLPDGFDEAQWSDEAFAVHRISRSRVAAAATASEVDARLTDWLLAHGAIQDRKVVVPVGFNVGSFDMPFLNRDLPVSAGLCSRRALDVNALCFAFAGWNPAGPARDFAGWKTAMKAAANGFLDDQGMATTEHDAGFDAAQALVGLWWLRSQFTGASAR